MFAIGRFRTGALIIFSRDFGHGWRAGGAAQIALRRSRVLFDAGSPADMALYMDCSSIFGERRRLRLLAAVGRRGSVMVSYGAAGRIVVPLASGIGAAGALVLLIMGDVDAWGRCCGDAVVQIPSVLRGRNAAGRCCRDTAECAFCRGVCYGSSL